jgi:hypothetical protein
MPGGGIVVLGADVRGGGENEESCSEHTGESRSHHLDVSSFAASGPGQIPGVEAAALGTIVV